MSDEDDLSGYVGTGGVVVGDNNGKNFFEKTEFKVLDFLHGLVDGQPSLDSMVDTLRSRAVKFERRGDSFWGVVEKIGPGAMNYHIFVTRDDLTIFRGTLQDSRHRVAYYNGVDANSFYEELRSNTPAVVATPFPKG